MNNTHTTTAPQNPQPKFTEATPEIIGKLAELPAPRSAWDSGVRAYALRLLGLYEVEHEGKPYKYGHGWLYRPIPAADLARIWNLLNA